MIQVSALWHFRTMRDFTPAEALAYAREHAVRGLKTYPYDTIYRTTLARIDEIEALLANGQPLSDLPKDPDLGLMAAKELGNDEAEFAHALHTIQYDIAHAPAAGRPA